MHVSTPKNIPQRLKNSHTQSHHPSPNQTIYLGGRASLEKEAEFPHVVFVSFYFSNTTPQSTLCQLVEALTCISKLRDQCNWRRIANV